MTKSRRMRWSGHVARISEMRNAYRLLVEKLEEGKSLWKSRCRSEDNIKMDLKETVRMEAGFI
jgi:hypothetical protein